MKLSIYAKKLGLTYRTAWSMFKRGEIEGAYSLPTGTIIVPEVKEQANRQTETTEEVLDDLIKLVDAFGVKLENIKKRNKC